MATTIILIAGAVLVISTVVVVINFASMAGSMKLEKGSFLVHLLGGAIMAGSFLTLLGGFIWFLLERFAK